MAATAVAAQPHVSSASGLLSLLEEDDAHLRLHALQSLNAIVHEFWFQIASSIASVEAFYEDEEFEHRELAALVASKVFYHLGELDDALTYALGAGKLFSLDEQSEYVQTILARCIDLFIEQQQAGGEQAVPVDERLTAIVQRMFDRCYRDGQFEQAVGIALEARQLDRLEQTIRSSPDMASTLTYALRVSQSLVVSRRFRQEVLRLLIRLYESVPDPDWVSICQCLMFLDDAPEVARILHQLVQGSQDDQLLALQACFDLFENEMQSFLLKVQDHLRALSPPRQSAAAAAPTEGAAGSAAPMDADAGDGAAAANTAAAAQAGAADGQQEAAAAPAQELTPEQLQHQRLADVLSGSTPIELHLQFLYSHNHADLQILKNAKAAVEVRNSVCHSAVIFANAIMHNGTTVDAFLRENLEWLSRATNWAKFGATAGLGVIHRGHLAQSRALMAPYLPGNNPNGSPYAEGGSLYALGLIHANHGQDIRTFLLECLRNNQNEVTQHGACLGLGLAALGSGDEELSEDVKNILYLDSAVAGEAAGIALGLLHAGSATDKATELLAYAHDTQHEKIIRGIAIGLAIIMYGHQEGADSLVEQMTRDQDPILRYGGMYVLGMAYRGTANNAAIQRLLHFAVTDVADDVRRAAVLNLGFVLMGVPEQCPRIVSLLSESFNTHVRYGAAMAVGIACASTGMEEALTLLQPLQNDPVDYVRQGAMIAMALVLMQQPESKVAPFRKALDQKIGSKHEETMSRMGAIMALGILDAGGRNANVAPRSRSGYFRRTSVIGLAVFTQYWYWYPLSYFLSLALQPTVMVGLNAELAMPKFEVTCLHKASEFAYPPPLTAEAKDTGPKVPTAVLSTTSRARDKAKKREASKAGKQGSGGVPSTVPPADKAAAGADGHEGEEAKGKDAKPDKGEAKVKPSAEAPTYKLWNPARVLLRQRAFISFDARGRYAPVARDRTDGILVVRDRRPGEPVEVVTGSGPSDSQQAPDMPVGDAPAQPPQQQARDQQQREEEPQPPAPFSMPEAGAGA